VNKFLLFGYQDLSELLSGGIVPLIGFLNFLSILPFSFWVHHPMQIYLGNYSTLETFYVFAGGFGWCVILYFLAQFIFKLGLKRNEAVGL
jgi:ABC-2 type transport system permease protein